MKPKPFWALNHLTVPMDMKRPSTIDNMPPNAEAQRAKHRDGGGPGRLSLGRAVDVADPKRADNLKIALIPPAFNVGPLTPRVHPLPDPPRALKNADAKPPRPSAAAATRRHVRALARTDRSRPPPTARACARR